MRSNDLANELAKFRSEIQEIAATIPTKDPSGIVDSFKDEMTNLTGAFEQRVDGAAQRVESAARSILELSDTVSGDRLDDAANRAERSASLLEDTVRNAVEALQGVLDAAGQTAAEPPVEVSMIDQVELDLEDTQESEIIGDIEISESAEFDVDIEQEPATPVSEDAEPALFAEPEPIALVDDGDDSDSWDIGEARA